MLFIVKAKQRFVLPYLRNGPMTTLVSLPYIKLVHYMTVIARPLSSGYNSDDYDYDDDDDCVGVPSRPSTTTNNSRKRPIMAAMGQTKRRRR